MVGWPHGHDGSFHGAVPVVGLLVVGASVRVAGQDRRIARRAGFDARPILRLEGDEDRRAAEALRGSEILAARDRAPELGPDEWWADDLEGCAVSDGSREVGVVT